MIKAKKSKSPKKLNISPYWFLLLWMIAPALGWLAVLPVVSLLGIIPINWDIFPIWFFTMGFGGVIGLGATIGQVIALRAGRGRWYWRWGILSMMGWLIGGVLLNFTDTVLGVLSVSSSLIENVVALSLFVGVAAIFQTVILRQWVRNAWLWLLTILSSSALFAFVIENTTGSIVMTAGAFGAYGLVTGLVMLWLLLANANTTLLIQQSAHNATRLADAETHLSDTSDI